MLKSVREAAKLIFFSGSTLALTGAGVSTESGIPDFRSPKSLLWERIHSYQFMPIEAYVDGDFNYIEIFYKYWFPLLLPMIYSEPNINHYFLLRLEAWGLLSDVVTQNTDGLHKKAGSSNVFEIHGNVGRGRCTRCAKKYPIEFVIEEIEALNIPPACSECGGIVGPDIVFAFERTPDYDEGLKRAVESEVLLVMGSSLLVDHVKEVVLGCIEGGGKLIIINSQPTPFDAAAEKGGGVVIRERLSSVVFTLWEHLSRYF